MRRRRYPPDFLPPIDSPPRLREVFGAGFPAAPCLVPELIMLGWSVFPRANGRGLTPHRHDGVWEICFLVEGATEWWVENEGNFQVGRGDWFITRPGELHGGIDGVMHPCELFWAQIALPLAGADLGRADVIESGLRALPVRQFPAHADVPGSLFTALMNEHRAAPDSLAPLAVRALLLRLMITLLRDATRLADAPQGAAKETAAETSLSPEIAHAQLWMQERLAEPFVIEDAARAVGLPPGRFYERFLREAGLPPGEWRTRTRIENGKILLLLPTHTITEIAFALGFPSSQHFATVFKKYTGRTPTQFRQNAPNKTP